jgi:hypothetical protein
MRGKGGNEQKENGEWGMSKMGKGKWGMGMGNRK